MKTNKYTITVFTENYIGLLSRVTLIFTRRHINIESITASESEVRGVHRYTIIVKVTEEKVKHLVKQIAKQVDALKAFYYQDDETIHQEIALYKVSTQFLEGRHDFEQLIRLYQARVLTVESEFIVLEKTGHKQETQELLELLQPYGVLEFVRSGRVSVSKQMKALSQHLNEMQQEQMAQLGK